MREEEDLRSRIQKTGGGKKVSDRHGEACLLTQIYYFNKLIVTSPIKVGCLYLCTYP